MMREFQLTSFEKSINLEAALVAFEKRVAERINHGDEPPVEATLLNVALRRAILAEREIEEIDQAIGRQYGQPSDDLSRGEIPAPTTKARVYFDRLTQWSAWQLAKLLGLGSYSLDDETGDTVKDFANQLCQILKEAKLLSKTASPLLDDTTDVRPAPPMESGS